ncbi:DUF6265 family protein [Ramlibacter solisilvae]|uniref:DUF6265 domain-containing protein n=1 Tax=Ramlibacter tataouinensis TaxID=94132 RepID=A0A127JUR3_9BURK|nr:DUF6265 family protein [Ramlibacter tataouinensis]AMO23609.1 hypothetical protein UC35_12815 [Ramlibacter tataouinensis]
MRFLPIAFCALAALTALPAVGQPVEKMAWLAGCWQGHFGEPGTVEQWLAPAGGTMLGMSRTIKQGKTAEYEFMHIRQLPEGVLAFVPQPNGRPPTVFRLLRLGESDALFENPEHDFPQRIHYARPAESRLVASIEGMRNGTMRRVEFAFSRVSCDAQAAGPGNK